MSKPTTYTEWKHIWEKASEKKRKALLNDPDFLDAMKAEAERVGVKPAGGTTMSKPLPDVPIPEAHKAAAERARTLFVSVPLTEGEKLPDPDYEDAMSKPLTDADLTALEQEAKRALVMPDDLSPTERRLWKPDMRVPGTTILALLTELRQARKSELSLRKWLWLNHGCRVNVLYGDDGEMQCNNADAHPGHRFLDFKRDDLPSLVVAVQNGAEAEVDRLTHAEPTEDV